MSSGLTFTVETLRVISLFLGGGRLAGYDVCRATGLGASTVYPILNRLDRHAMLSSETERVDPSISERQPRILYKLTENGSARVTELRALLST